MSLLSTAADLLGLDFHAAGQVTSIHWRKVLDSAGTARGPEHHTVDHLAVQRACGCVCLVECAGGGLETKCIRQCSEHRAPEYGLVVPGKEIAS